MQQHARPHAKLPSGESLPVLGQGTWHFGERPERRSREIEALRFGIDLGMTVIDTAEMYGDGAAERLVADAAAGRRADVFLVSKVLPGHAVNRRRLIAACEGSLRRLRTEYIDLYLLHWRGQAQLALTVEVFHQLIRVGKIRHWGVSNFDLHDLKELERIPGGESTSTNQVLYNLAHRGIEHDLLPQQLRRGAPVMAYSPIDQGRLLEHRVVRDIAQRRNAKPTQIALAWVLRHTGIVAIPKAASRAHVQQNFGALNIVLSARDLTELDRAFPPPRTREPLAML